MTTQIKMFNNYNQAEFEENINNWINDNPHFYIISINYQFCLTTDYRYTALIHYKITSTINVSNRLTFFSKPISL